LSEPAPGSTEPTKFRNPWPMILGCGCLVVLLGGAGFGACLGFIPLVIVGSAKAVQSTAGFQTAMAKVRANPAVQQALGSPIEEPGFSGQWNYSNKNGVVSVRFECDLTGPSGTGHVRGVASAQDGTTWTLAELHFTGPDGKTLDLLAESR